MEFRHYLVTFSENTLGQLALVTCVTLLAFLYRASARYLELRHARRSIPLTIGGWGTRGKSGTERIKAALFHALGAEVLVKTTGNEAMFIHSVPEQKPMEIFIFRPYDKATIWEQQRVTKLAGDLGVHVLMWECMALNPRYVRILERVWMRDDLVTITNTYPDHEDLQGPAGVNIPQVMTQFIPENKVCFTAEDQMLPILQQGADERHTQLVSLGWRDSAFLTSDILGRFPYQEHPSNVALVTKLAGHLGIDADFTVKEMADNVVPDIGVLKTYPIATYLGRRLEFTLGNSANERRGFMNNWTRTGFDHHDRESDAGVWITTCVNNRGDRIPRSIVFANILVMDISAHKHFLIGTNLSGLQGYLDEVLKRRLEHLTLIDESDFDGLTPDARVERADTEFLRLCDEFKVPAVNAADVERHLNAMLTGLELDETAVSSVLSEDARDAIARLDAGSTAFESLGQALEPHVGETVAADVVAFLRRYVEAAASVDRLRERIRSLSTSDARAWEQLNDDVKTFSQAAFNSTLEVIQDAHATGDQIVARIAQCAPPGFRVRIMGTQNIKGTGLDFVYHWLALEKVREKAVALESSDETLRMDAVRWFQQFADYGVLGSQMALDALTRAQNDTDNHTAAMQQLLSAAVDYVEAQRGLCEERLDETRQMGALSAAVAMVEQFFDASDSRKRRRSADRILTDLVNQRISHNRAEIELRDLTKRQKGGWLEKQVARGMSRLFGRRNRSTQTGMTR